MAKMDELERQIKGLTLGKAIVRPRRQIFRDGNTFAKRLSIAPDLLQAYEQDEATPGLKTLVRIIRIISNARRAIVFSAVTKTT